MDQSQKPVGPADSWRHGSNVGHADQTMALVTAPDALPVEQQETEQIEQKVWHTGDWITGGRPHAPYNGVAIAATAFYRRTAKQRLLVSVDLEITDYTRRKQGVVSKLKLERTGAWYEIPVPVLLPVTKLNQQSDPDFTVTGNGTYQPGKVRLDATSDGMYLNVLFRYGLPHAMREELGYIMKISKTYRKDAIEVEE